MGVKEAATVWGGAGEGHTWRGRVLSVWGPGVGGMKQEGSWLDR